MNRLTEADPVLGLIDGFFDRLIARGVSRVVQRCDDMPAEPATGQSDRGMTRWAA
jgi:hypothetical protein